MRWPWWTRALFLLLGLALGGSLARHWLGAEPAPDDAAPPAAAPGEARKAPHELRIASLSPSVTETLFALGAGGQLAGVCDFCRYPAEVAGLPKLGQYHAPNLEAIFSLGPDLVALLVEQRPFAPSLDNAGLAYLTVDQRSWEGILASFATLGAALGREAEAERLADSLRRSLAELAERHAGRPPVRALVVLSRAYGAGGLRDVYIAGRDRLYDVLLEAAGGRNAYEGDLAFPALSAEGVLKLNPEAVIEILPVPEGGMGAAITPEAALRDWESLSDLAAARQGRVYFLQTDYASIPGPRFVRVAEDFARMLHSAGD